MGLTHNLGRTGEEAALEYFQKKGAYLLRRNFRVRSMRSLSEIDLIFLAAKRNAPLELQQSFSLILRSFHVVDVLKDFVESQFSYLEIIFVEVKYWKAYPVADLCYNLSIDRQQRMFDTALCFLQQHLLYLQLSKRFDLVIFDKNGKMHHIEAAFP